MINANWARWIFASISVHFDSNRGSIPMYVEGQDRNTADLDEYIEVRVDGPYYKEIAKDYYNLDLEINILCCTKRDDSDNYKIYRLTGLIASIFINNISVFKFGDNANELLGCLKRRDDKREAVVTSHFGQLDPDIPVLQATVEAHYRMELINGTN